MDRPLNTALGWKLPSWLLDYGPVGFILLEGLIAIRVRVHSGEPNGKTWLLALALVLLLTALSLRHRVPIVTLVVTLGVSVVSGYEPIAILPVLLALFTIAEYRARRVALTSGALAALALIAIPPIHAETLYARAVLSLLVAVALPVAAGLYVKTRADYMNGLTDRAERLERERELLADHAVAEERVRIARELHDVVAHNVSLMVVQAQALAATSGEPEQHATLRLVADLGRDALSEMHRMLGVLRLDDQAEGAAERAPQPGVRDLEKLITRAREAGLDVQLQVEGDARELPAGVDLSAYRIVQEALTNVIRHARAGHADVRLTYDNDQIEVSVCDDGSGGSEVPAGTDGHGLVGMRERVALFGGNFSAGRTENGGGFQVRASLPLS